jgi:hypothetical protein
MESSTPTSSGGILSSPRAQRRLLLFSGTVFCVGLILFLSLVVLKGPSALHSPISNKPAQHAPPEIKAPPAKEAIKVGREFIETAVLRKHLAQSYKLVNGDVRGGLTKKQWLTGNIPVIGYPAGNTRTAAFLTDWSYTNQVMFTVDLVAKRGANVRPHLPFFLGLVRVGHKGHYDWRVNYWQADWRPPLPYGGQG